MRARAAPSRSRSSAFAAPEHTPPPVRSPAGRPDPDDVARRDPERALVAQRDGTRLIACRYEPVLAARPCCTAGKPPGCVQPSLGYKRHRRVLEDLQLAPDPVTAGVRAITPAPAPEGVPPHPQRQRALECLDRRVTGVGHPGMYTAHAVGPGPRTLAAADRLVVDPPVAADQHVVHGSLVRRADAIRHNLRERAETPIGNALADFDVARANCDRRLRGDDSAWRSHDSNRPHRAAVRRNARIGDRTQGERDRADRHGLDRVHVAWTLLVGAGEVERHVVTVDGECEDETCGRLLLAPRAS